MRKYVGPLIGLAVFVVLLVFVLATQGGGTSTSSPTATPTVSAAQQDLQIYNLPATDPINQLEVKTVTSTLTIKLDNGNWSQTAPTALALDGTVISDTVRQLSTLRGLELIPADKAGNLATYGLDKPSLTLTLNAGSGPKTLIFGLQNDATKNYYVKKGDDAKVWAVSPTLVSTILGWTTKPPTPAPTIAPVSNPLTPLPTVTPTPTATPPPTPTVASATTAADTTAAATTVATTPTPTK